MTLRQIQYLIALADAGHFGRAAERCCVSQSTLSLQLRRMETYLGLELFDRERRGIWDTPAAREIVELGRQMLRLAGAIRQVAARAPAGVAPARAPARPIDTINCKG
ncbi:MAG: hypothetical protein B7Z66_09435 [Chromatiales bacterium 21-64-14]|nr:MAG: hypothetical protein B7Z66_09435 [Chromatiales bacterium 21-64-14]HQU16171.1 LysR family transcriptional regulator [Gammaproteobacteria bacterium]